MLKSNTFFNAFPIGREHAEDPITTAQLTSSKVIKLLGTYLLVIIAHQQCKPGSDDYSEGAGNLALLPRRSRVMSRNRCEPQLLVISLYRLLAPGSYPGKSWKAVRETPLPCCWERSTPYLSASGLSLYLESQSLPLLIPKRATSSPRLWNKTQLRAASHPSLVCPALCPSAPQGLWTHSGWFWGHFHFGWQSQSSPAPCHAELGHRC